MIDKPYAEMEQQPRQPQETQNRCSTDDYSHGCEANPTATTGAITHDAVPYPGETFIILHKASGRAIALLQDGTLQLEEEPISFPRHPGITSTSTSTSTSNIHWLCVERNGWLGFRSVSEGGGGLSVQQSGRYIGQSIMPNNRKSIEATATHHQAWEYFCARRHPRGGYLLLSPIEDPLGKVEPWLCTLWKMEVLQDGERERGGGKLVLREDGGSIWEFIRVGSMI